MSVNGTFGTASAGAAGVALTGAAARSVEPDCMAGAGRRASHTPLATIAVTVTTIRLRQKTRPMIASSTGTRSASPGD